MSWRDRAACRGHDPEIWFPFPLDDETREAAISICGTCPVITPCAADAERHGDRCGVRAGVDLGLPGAVRVRIPEPAEAATG